MADNITTIRYEDKEIILIGTAHVLHESVELVKQTIDNLLPDTICIELDDERYKNLQNPKAWENTNIADVIKSKKVGLLLAKLNYFHFNQRCNCSWCSISKRAWACYRYIYLCFHRSRVPMEYLATQVAYQQKPIWYVFIKSNFIRNSICPYFSYL